MQTNTVMPTFPTQLYILNIYIYIHVIVIHFGSGRNFCRYLLTGKTRMVVVYRKAIVLVVAANMFNIQQTHADSVTYSAKQVAS